MEVSTDKPGSSGRKELSASSGPHAASSFTQSPAPMHPTSLEQVEPQPSLLSTVERLHVLFCSAHDCQMLNLFTD